MINNLLILFIYFCKYVLNLTLSSLSRSSLNIFSIATEKINIISKQTTTNLSMNVLSTWFINLMKVLGALVKPKGITNYSYNPNMDLKVIFHSSPSLMQIW